MMKKISEMMKKWKEDSGSKRVCQFKFDSKDGTLYIYTSQPGFFIGKGGVLVKKYEEMLKNEVENFKKIEFVETYYYWV